MKITVYAVVLMQDACYLDRDTDTLWSRLFLQPILNEKNDHIEILNELSYSSMHGPILNEMCVFMYCECIRIVNVHWFNIRWFPKIKRNETKAITIILWKGSQIVQNQCDNLQCDILSGTTIELSQSEYNSNDQFTTLNHCWCTNLLNEMRYFFSFVCVCV